MANTQAQYGFAQYGYLPGGAVDYQYSTYPIQSTFSTIIYNGTPVVKSGAYIIPAIGTGNLTAISGIFYGCQYTPTGGGAPQWSPFWPGAAASDAVAYVTDAPNALFRVASLLTAIPATAMGANIGFSTGAGGTTSGAAFATYVVDQATITTGPTAAFQLVDFYPGVGNGSDTTTSYNWVIVTFNNQRYRTNTGV